MQAQQLSTLLVDQGLLSAQAAQDLLQQAQSQQIAFTSLLLREQCVDPTRLAPLIARAFACPLLDISSLAESTLCEAAKTEHRELLLRTRTLPLSQRGQVLQVAMADPASLAALAASTEFRQQLLQPLIVDVLGLDRILARLSGERQPEAAAELLSDEAPVVHYVNQILFDAVRLKASDIHIEPFESCCRIRYRVDGVLQENARASARLSARLCSRLKVMAALDITERRRPQDGRIRLKLADGAAVDLRISTLPTLWGEKIVLRILDGTGSRIPLGALGCLPAQLQLYREALSRRQGMILVTGPTGSGKTVTLYSGLAQLNASERNIATAEDPVEINLEGINQVAVNPRQGMDFATALRAFLRQDPDVVMLGEIRDQETADIAIKAAQTGHLVLSTLHTNSAIDTLLRLQNMGIAAYNLAGALSLIISQRLVRRLCPHCSQWSTLSKEEANCWRGQQAPPQLRRAVGCAHCQQGYRGRIAVMEMLPVTAQLRSLISQQAPADALQQLAQQTGWPDLFSSGLARVAAGDTSLEEVRRVLS